MQIFPGRVYSKPEFVSCSLYMINFADLTLPCLRPLSHRSFSKEPSS